MSEQPLYKNKIFFYLLLITSVISYYWLCYQTKRENFYQLAGLFSILFIAYYFLIRFFSIIHFNYLFIAGIIFRSLLLFSVPNLSDDVYRFIWDGRLAVNGINPFSHLPTEIMQMPAVTGITQELFEQLNSQQHYTIYPPVLQGIYWLTAKLFPLNVSAAIIFLKCVIILSETGIFFLLLQFLKKLSLPKPSSLLYILNPLVITELTGNAHFDGVMILFVLLSMLFLFKKNSAISAFSLATGIATKLIPVLFLPLIIMKSGWKKGVSYLLITGITTFFLFALVFDLATVNHLLKSADLFIRKFEFNASVYYVVRYVGTLIKGYNIIAIAGPFLIALSALIILIISFNGKKKSYVEFITKALFIITAWLLFSTTVHPWYICLPVTLTVFTFYRYPIIWSFTTTLSYAAYQYNPVQENLWLVAAGYIFVIGYGLWELMNKRQIITLPPAGNS